MEKILKVLKTITVTQIPATGMKLPPTSAVSRRAKIKQTTEVAKELSRVTQPLRGAKGDSKNKYKKG